MTDFENAIRDRMVETDLILPVSGFSLNDTGSEQAVKHLRPVLYELVGQTARSEKERGVSAWHFINRGTRSVGSMSVSPIDAGSESSIISSDPPSAAPIGFDLHTHPIPGSTRFSTADISSMANTLLQYPEDVDFTVASRHFGVITQRLGDPEDGKAAISVVSVGPEVAQLSIDEQRDLTQDMIQAEKDATSFAQFDERVGRASEYLTMSRETFELPEPAGKLRFRSAVPDTIPDREFGNAYADGDLRPVLNGDEWI